jgi:hypothetical protein
MRFSKKTLELIGRNRCTAIILDGVKIVQIQYVTFSFSTS